ncbi:valine--tRNA ligase [Halobaculum sp. MBLA0147]|uniref:valine--tRNA ligase n=1 Tax=Halobaculum sp. MBLA0147 TaxID=3079934 RepID=UPI003523C030
MSTQDPESDDASDAATGTDTDTGDAAETPVPSLSGEYDPEATEDRWQRFWVDDETYRFGDGDADPNTAYTVDTPPPTVSGSLHMGHLYGSTLQDFAARFHRMHDGDAMFPFGYDDNGIASELLTEEELGIHHSDYTRREFQEKCREVCAEYEESFTNEMQSLGVSIDWSRTYKTIEPRVQRISQLSFLDLYEKGREYRERAPTIWCPDCETAISQVEMEEEKRDSEFVDLAFELVEPGSEPPADPEREASDYPVPTEAGDDVVISTTRPELLPACVAMFVHPDDDANQHLVGGTARVPLFGHEVPIYADDRVEAETGTGIVMCCTFGDQTDIEWYQAHDLDLRVAIDESATMTDLAGDYEGLSTEAARDAIKDDLDAAGRLLARDPIEHVVQVHERSCDAAVEYLVTEQWYVELLDHTDEYLEAGREMDWYPEKMFSRYEHWIEGLEWDWCISRQRDSGIPFPVWYCADCDEAIFADPERLPVDPIADEPSVDACPECGHDEFEAEEDVFDTWATSSLTPLINAGWDYDADAGEITFDEPGLYPMDLRPQGHDIVSFWLFHTIVKCVEHTGEVPFDSVLINGWVLDENREKMSSSRGNVVLPEEVMAEYPVDAIRYWASGYSVGDDFPYKTNELRQGEKLIQKIWNASKLVDDLASEAAAEAELATTTHPTTDAELPAEPETLEPVDEWLLSTLDDIVETATDHFAAHEYAKARTELRTFFWDTFCDNYLELAKQRDGAAASTAYTLRTVHETVLRLFAPILPFVTEEVWTATYAPAGDADTAEADADATGEGAADAPETGAADAADADDTPSLHRQGWPEPRGYDAPLAPGERAMRVISALRSFKSDRGLALNADLPEVEVYGDIAGFEDAVASVMHVDELTVSADATAPQATAEIADIDLDYATVGPKYGDAVGDIEADIASGAYELDGDTLAAGGETLTGDEFEVVETHSYDGAGELIETESVVLVVHTDD